MSDTYPIKLTRRSHCPMCNQPMTPIDHGTDTAKAIAREFLSWLEQEENSFAKPEQEIHKIQTQRIIHHFKEILAKFNVKVDG